MAPLLDNLTRILASSNSALAPLTALASTLGITHLLEVATTLHTSFSGSWEGDAASAYIRDFRPRDPTDSYHPLFLGLAGYARATGDWCHYDYAAVTREVFRRAGISPTPDPFSTLDTLQTVAQDAAIAFTRSKVQLTATLDAYLSITNDRIISSLRKDLDGLPSPLSPSAFIRPPRVRRSQQLNTPPHILFQAQIIAHLSAQKALTQLVSLLYPRILYLQKKQEFMPAGPTPDPDALIRNPRALTLLADLTQLTTVAQQDFATRHYANYRQYLLEFNRTLQSLEGLGFRLDIQPIQDVPEQHRAHLGIGYSDSERAKLREIGNSADRLQSRVRQLVGTQETTPKTGLPRVITRKRKVFIGHGDSEVWRQLKDLVTDRLNLDYEAFNRVSPAGIPTTERLQQMLDACGFAFLVFTAEDQNADGSFHARLNVIHEAGLFQGKYGFQRAIILIEEGCTEFSNIHGLGQIRFPRGHLTPRSEDIRKVLEREGLLS